MSGKGGARVTPRTLVRTEPVVLLVASLALLLLSGISPRDRFTWFLETAPIFIGVPRVPVTNLIRERAGPLNGVNV